MQVLTTVQNISVEFYFVSGSEGDVQAPRKLPLAVAAESRIYEEAAYTNYTIEDDMMKTNAVELKIQRRSNIKRKDKPWISFLKEHIRKGIETSF